MCKVVKEMNKHFCRYLETHKKEMLGSITLEPNICDIPTNPSYIYIYI